MKHKLNNSQFAIDVLKGLNAPGKSLSSRYFYDEAGDKLFQKIMELDEYYLTRAERWIFENRKKEILQLMRPDESFSIVELGAGDGSKTKVLLKHFLESGMDFEYCPVDISANVLKILKSNLEKELNGLRVHELVGDYFHALHDQKFRKHGHTIVYFLGSNIGNYREDAAVQFLTSVRKNLNPGDRMLIGFDLKKDPDVILAAYNDAEGVTAAFNKNLLTRINRELGANFDLEGFKHSPVYDPMTGECRSYLVSLLDQEVEIADLDRTFHFRKWETIFMEVSKKYDFHEIETLAKQSGFRLIQNLTDQQELFVDSIWEAH